MISKNNEESFTYDELCYIEAVLVGANDQISIDVMLSCVKTLLPKIGKMKERIIHKG